MTLHHIFQKVDRVLRNRPDALRWRVTTSEHKVEVFRRPILTSDVTLGALGLTDAPMPVPRCVAQITLKDAHTASILGLDDGTRYDDPINRAVDRVLWLVRSYAESDD